MLKLDQNRKGLSLPKVCFRFDGESDIFLENNGPTPRCPPAPPAAEQRSEHLAKSGIIPRLRVGIHKRTTPPTSFFANLFSPEIKRFGKRERLFAIAASFFSGLFVFPFRFLRTGSITVIDMADVNQKRSEPHLFNSNCSEEPIKGGNALVSFFFWDKPPRQAHRVYHHQGILFLRGLRQRIEFRRINIIKGILSLKSYHLRWKERLIAHAQQPVPSGFG
jgi:hypothetical protein